MLVVSEGIDGIGKSSLFEGVLSATLLKGKKVFNLMEYWLEDHTKYQAEFKQGSADWFRRAFVPPDEILDAADIIKSCEPTYGAIGLAIRGIGINRFSKGVQEHGTYPGAHLARLYSEDRLLLRKEIVEPWRGRDKTRPDRNALFIQSRCEATLLVYEYHKMLQDNPGANKNAIVDYLLGLEGNAFCLERAPDVLMIQYLENIELLRERLEQSGDASDGMEQYKFQAMISPFYTEVPFIRGQTLPEFYKERGSHVVLLDASKPKEEVARNARNALEEYLQNPS